ncbi:MAG: hypothetical protein J6J81_03420 [Oscillospiraceae bacterium]|nr:hypothetical protein [Oscillospiraceae bacterium]
MEQDRETKRLRGFLEKYGFVLLILLAGVALLLWPTEPKEERDQEQTEVVWEAEGLSETEERMRNILSKIDGVGQLELMLTVESTQEREFMQDTELSYSGTTAAPDDYTRRSEAVVLSGDNGEEPVMVRNVGPTYRGALVVCTGGGNAEVKLAVTQAVAALTGLSSDRITVVKCQS